MSRLVLWPIAACLFLSSLSFAKDFSGSFRHQFNTATCWLQCGTTALDFQASQKFGTQVTFSSDYILLQDLRSRALAKFLGHETPWDPGAGMTRSLAISLEHGLYPEEVWQPRVSILHNEQAIQKALDELLQFANNHHLSQKDFVQLMDQRLLQWVGKFPPKKFWYEGRFTDAHLLANEVIDGDAMAYEFRPIPYNGTEFGMVSKEAWSHVISADGSWKAITDVLGKQLHFMDSPQAAIKKAEEIYHSGRPLYLTFIYFDDVGDQTFKMQNDTYFPTNPPRETYASSHFVFVTRLEYDAENNLRGFWVRDSVPRDNRERFASIEFIEQLGKTFHTIGLPCESHLVGSHQYGRDK